MTVTDVLRRAAEMPLQTKRGKPASLDLRPPATAGEIANLESRLPCPLPEEIRELLAYSRGFSCGALDFLDFVDFTGGDCLIQLEEVFPHGLPFAHDGFGNFWVLDLWPDSSGWGPIYFSCHDAPVVLYQGPTLQDFLGELLKALVPPFKSAIEDVQHDETYKVWSSNPGVRSYEECMTSGDADLAAFAGHLGASFQIIDLRSAEVGRGFSWGRYGPDTSVRRWGRLPIFAYEKRERRGLLARLFGRG